MPKFLRNSTIALIDGGIESYLLALYGMVIPQVRPLRKSETKYAPVMGLFGAAAELLSKACVVQAKGISEMYQNGYVQAGTYRFGNEVIEDLRRYIRDEDDCIAFVWEDATHHEEQKKQLLHCLGQFKLLQQQRASGLHAGVGCSRDIAVAVSNVVSDFILLLSKSKKLGPYLKNVPVPESTIRDREAIIEDLTRRVRSAKTNSAKAEYLRGMYLVLPYIPEVAPDWIDVFDRIAVAPPTEGDLAYLTKTLEDAHSIYLIKNRGGREGVPVRVDPNDPNALPIAIQNIKRELNSTPDKFYNDALSANTRLSEKRLDLPIDEFLVDLYAIGLDGAGIIDDTNKKLTAQQVWPFVAAAYSTNGTPRPCWFAIRQCDEIDRLVSYMKQVEQYGNGYIKRRMPDLLLALEAYKNQTPIVFEGKKGSPFKDVAEYKQKINNITAEQRHPFTPVFLRKNPLNDVVNAIIREFVIGSQGAGKTLAALMDLDSLDESGRKAALTLLPLCYSGDDKNGLISVLRGEHLKGYVSTARKMMFMADFLENGPPLV